MFGHTYTNQWEAKQHFIHFRSFIVDSLDFEVFYSFVQYYSHHLRNGFSSSGNAKTVLSYRGQTRQLLVPVCKYMVVIWTYWGQVNVGFELDSWLPDLFLCIISFFVALCVSNIRPFVRRLSSLLHEMSRLDNPRLWLGKAKSTKALWVAQFIGDGRSVRLH